MATTITDVNRPPTTKTKHRPRSADFARNAFLLGALWVAYAAVRGITAGDFATAADNAEAIISLQHNLGLPSEATLQYAVLGHTWLIKGANFYYVVVHFPITIAFLAWTWIYHRSKFARVRNALIATTSAGLAIHVIYPLKPPRMMVGFVDTARLFGPDPYALGISGGANQLAAMPSLHVGWALLIALSVIWISNSSMKWVILAHPIITLAVVVLTANHYWIDAFAAAAIVAASWQLTHPATLGTTAIRREIVQDRRLRAYQEIRQPSRRSTI